MIGDSRISKRGINAKHLFKETETLGPKWNCNIFMGLEHDNTVQQDRKVQLLLSQ